jgi:hypothetical protein
MNEILRACVREKWKKVKRESEALGNLGKCLEESFCFVLHVLCLCHHKLFLVIYVQ